MAGFSSRVEIPVNNWVCTQCGTHIAMTVVAEDAQVRAKRLATPEEDHVARYSIDMSFSHYHYAYYAQGDTQRQQGLHFCPYCFLALEPHPVFPGEEEARG